jgi:hypothetical protein
LKITIVILIILLLIGCECVTDIDTPKNISPSTYAHIMTLSAAPEFDELKIFSEFWQKPFFIYYNNSDDNFSYRDITYGLNNIKVLTKKDSVIFNSTLSLEKTKYYTFIIFGTKQRIQAMLLKDSVYNYKKTTAYFRCIHTSSDVPQVNFIINSSYPIIHSQPYKTNSAFTPIVSGFYSIKINNSLTDSTLIHIKNYEFKEGFLYSIILKGYAEGKGSKALECQIIENDEFYKKNE